MKFCLSKLPSPPQKKSNNSHQPRFFNIPSPNVQPPHLWLDLQSSPQMPPTGAFGGFFLEEMLKTPKNSTKTYQAKIQNHEVTKSYFDIYIYISHKNGKAVDESNNPPRTSGGIAQPTHFFHVNIVNLQRLQLRCSEVNWSGPWLNQSNLKTRANRESWGRNVFMGPHVWVFFKRRQHKKKCRKHCYEHQPEKSWVCFFLDELWVAQNLTEIAGVSRVVKSYEELRSDFSRELLICVAFFFQILKWPKAKNALPESNIAPENRKLVFQASIFRCELLVSGRAVSPPRSCPLHPLICPKIGSPARSFNLFRCLKREIRYHWINASSRMLSIQTSHQVGAGYEHPLNHFRLGWLESSHDIDIITSHYGFRGFRAPTGLGGAAKEPRNRRSIHLPLPYYYQGHIISDTLQKNHHISHQTEIWKIIDSK